MIARQPAPLSRTLGGGVCIPEGRLTAKKACSHNPGELASAEKELCHRSLSPPHDPQSALDFPHKPPLLVSLSFCSPPLLPVPDSMGCTQSNSYYFGIVNLSLDHLDVFSFALGVVFILGVSYTYSYCKYTRRASRHVLGKTRHSEARPPRAPPSSPFPWRWSSARTQGDTPPAAPPPTAPPGTGLMAWPSQQCL